ncbi:MAG: hypothetical protein Fur0024_2550 [Patescibacteria group bacterium]
MINDQATQGQAMDFSKISMNDLKVPDYLKDYLVEKSFSEEEIKEFVFVVRFYVITTAWLLVLSEKVEEDPYFVFDVLEEGGVTSDDFKTLSDGKNLSNLDEKLSSVGGAWANLFKERFGKDYVTYTNDSTAEFLQGMFDELKNNSDVSKEQVQNVFFTILASLEANLESLKKFEEIFEQ